MANLQWSGIVNDSDTGADVSTKLDTSFLEAENAITALENTVNASNTLVLSSSNVTTQEPTATDTPLQIAFGAATTFPDASVAADGSITFVNAGDYVVSFNAIGGRNAASGTSLLHFRSLINTVQFGATNTLKLDGLDTLIPFKIELFVSASINDVLTFELIRDSLYDNSGGLYSTTPTLSGWSASPSASIEIRKA